ncbi:hypothetical protein D3C78_1864450 [compost metagenome]
MWNVEKLLVLLVALGWWGVVLLLSCWLGALGLECLVVKSMLWVVMSSFFVGV